MPVISFDYLPRPYVSKNKLIAIYTPIIPIRLSANYRIYPYSINCLLDSGADFNLLPADIGEELGLKITKGKKVEHLGIGNIGIVAYRHPAKLFIKNYMLKTEIDFSYDHKIPLLGRHGFFAFFKRVTFNEENLRVDLEYK